MTKLLLEKLKKRIITNYYTNQDLSLDTFSSNYYWKELNNDLQYWLNEGKHSLKNEKVCLKGTSCFSLKDYIGYYFFNTYSEKEKCEYILNKMTLTDYIGFYKFMWDVLIIISKEEYEEVVQQISEN